MHKFFVFVLLFSSICGNIFSDAYQTIVRAFATFIVASERGSKGKMYGRLGEPKTKINFNLEK